MEEEVEGQGGIAAEQGQRRLSTEQNQRKSAEQSQRRQSAEQSQRRQSAEQTQKKSLEQRLSAEQNQRRQSAEQNQRRQSAEQTQKKSLEQRLSAEQNQRRQSAEQNQRKSLEQQRLSAEQSQRRQSGEQNQEHPSEEKRNSRKDSNSKAMRLLKRSMANEKETPSVTGLVRTQDEEMILREERVFRVSPLHSSSPSHSQKSHHGITLLDQLHHNLKPREEDVLFLKKRILFPGIFEQESSDEEATPLRTIRRQVCKPKAEPVMEKVERKSDIGVCGASSSTGKVGSGTSKHTLEEKHSQLSMTGCLVGIESKVRKRVSRPQDESICDLQKKLEKEPSIVKAEWKHYDEDDFTDGGTMVAGSEMTLNEKLCLLEAEAKKPVSTKEHYVGHRGVPGYPKCIDRTLVYQECLPPGEVVRNAIDTQKLWGIPKGVLLSRSQFVELMERLEHHYNNDYICLVFALPFSDPEYNPYSFRIIKYSDVGNRIHYTVSRYGALYMANGMADFISMLHIHTHMRVYDKVRSLPFFYNYRVWRAFYLWRHVIRDEKMGKIKSQVAKNVFVTKRPLRIMLLELMKMCGKLTTMSLLNVKHGVTYALSDFVESQVHHLEGVTSRFRAFEGMVIEMTTAACRAALIEEGFSPDKYPEEMEFYMKQLEIPIQSLGKNLDTSLQYPGQWLSYSQQRKKRQVSKRITEFIRLVDYLVQSAYHKLLKNSMFLLVLEMHARLPFVPLPYYADFAEEEEFAKLQNHVHLYYGTPTLSGVTEPMFDIGCFWNDEGLVFSPSILEYVKGWQTVLEAWRQVILSYKNMLSIPPLNPYTQPIINGYVDPKTCGEGPDFAFFLDLDAELASLAITGEEILRHSFQISDQYIAAFNSIRLFCLENQKLDLDILRNETDVQKFQVWLEKFWEQRAILEQVEDVKSMGVFRVNNSILRAHANPTIERCLEVLHEVMPVVGAQNVIECSSRMQKAIECLQSYPKTADDYVEYLMYMEEINDEMEEIEKDLDITAELFDLMEDYKIESLEEDLEGFGALQPTLLTLRELIDTQIANRDKLMAELKEQFRIETEQIFTRMGKIRKTVEAPEVLAPESNPVNLSEKLTDVRDILLADQEKATKFNSYQRKLKVDVTDFEELDKLIAFTKIRHQLWDSIARWDVQKNEWDATAFSTLVPELMTREVNDFIKSIQQLEKGLPPNEVVPILKEKVEFLRLQLPWIANLHNPNIRQRHWDVMEKKMGMSLTDPSTTLKQLMDHGIADYAEFIQEMSAQASSEFSLEALLKKVEDSWQDIEFIVLSHKDQRDVFILGGTDDIQVLLDDSLINMTTISSSRHVGPIKPKVDEWVKLLDLFSSTLDEWMNCQRNWIHLESVFSAPDIQRQLPNEARMFSQVDKSWREVMSKTNRNPLALRAATAPGLLETFLTNNELLEQIMKCLDDYLESKRVIFPRFYFLSNEELLEILAQTRNPSAVQPHLRKCFDAVQRLEFGGPVSSAAMDIMAMFSPEDERVALTKGLKTRGNVEEWLGRVEDAMFGSLKRIMRNCLTDWHSMEREEWVQRFPSQCVLSISQLMWAQIVHMILDGPGNSILGMREFEKKNFENLKKLATMVRGQLPPLVRAVLCALITIDVHGRDIITSLVQKKVEISSNFEWLKQLRYYWNAHDEVVVAKMANAQYNYGYEYLGASPRLVITPLTDRCYLCLMGALQLDLGGAPAGPAGTGKTETTKDLAKSLAFMCVVFNCSEGLDYKMMGRFFSGLAQSGGWCCFDEFNRIDIEVLSVIAQQLITIRLAKVARAARFMFEGHEIKLIRTCAAFITMNPGYAGRTELPDNLKSLFRPISMMVPDYTLIAEVILYSEGFEGSKSLAHKMTQMYKLCSEQLSQQDHYDFGMRAVKSVLVMAGSLKRSNPDINENIVLIRALRDSNLPKFLAHDAILLHGIIADLFPGVEIPEQDYGLLQRESLRCALEKGLQTPECFINKVIQLYETLVVRHGVMLVGPTGGGKTTIYGVLKNALTSLYQAKVEHPFYMPVDTYILNPKAVAIGELYGDVNPLTFEWHDGLLGIMVRNSVKPNKTHHQWIICDGPVDAIWIENMNTVLDDNKMLCLANSERIKLTNWVRMMFEVQDLAQASPATVSRCGMVYVDPNEMGWKPFVQSWMQRTLSSDQHLVREYLLQLFDKYVDGGFAFVRKNCVAGEVMPQSVMGKIAMMCSILQAILKKKTFDYEMETPRLLQQTSQVFLFAYIWSIGSNLQDKYHPAFDTFVRDQFANEEVCKLPKSGLLWGYFNNLETKKMEAWETIMPSFVYLPSVPFVDMLVPTVDTVRFGYLMELLLSVNRAVMFTGPTGTGKSAIAKYVLTTISGPNNYLPVFMNFSAQTTSKRTQEMIEEKLEKRKKSMLSAPIGKKVIVFIDDVNMPKLDRYGAQPSLELLRQLLDFNGCYDRVKMFWRELQNVILSAACAPPGGGRNAITPRLLRHFCMMAIPIPTQTVLNNIYRAIMRGFLKDFDAEVRDMAESIVTASIATYQFMAAAFLPTPSKAHYLFNMRDLSKCIQGILQANKDVVVRKGNMIRLYYHECLRVFHDRLTTEEDRHLFCNSLAEICTSTFKVDTSAEECKGIIFGDFMKMGFNKADCVYDEIVNKEKLKTILTDYLDEYNVGNSKEMNLVFFYDAAEHVARVARILRTDRGNALLVGVGGTGKQSLTRLASYISGYRCFQVELMRGYDYSSFHDDLKKLYDTAGMKNEPIVFLFTDTQIAYEEFLEDINNILNSGEVPNLLEPEDLERMLAPIRADAKNLGIKEGDRDQLYDCFIRRIRSNLHIVLCMSPVGDSFRIRCRMFPSLVNCCTINWFSEWPTEALLSVAVTLMSKIQIGVVTPEAMAEVSVFVHESVTAMAARYYEEMRRRFYTTPSSYLELINLYGTMLKEQRDKILQGKARIQNGLSKLLETNEVVRQMRAELRDLEPILVQKSQAVEDLMVQLAEDQAAADVVRRNVTVEEAAAKEKAMETQAIAEDAQKDLALALPALEAAVKSLDQLNKEDINELRAFQKPPELVRTVMESVCVLFGAKPDWNTSRLLLSDSYFLKKLYDFNKDNISEGTLKKLKVYIDNPKFNAKAVEKVSLACKSICLWVRAIDGYAKIFKTVEPKRNRYLGAQAELDQVMETLRGKQEQLNEVEMKIASLQTQFQNVTKEKTDLEDSLELIAARLNRAGRLTKALASEQTRWAETVLKFDEEMKNIIGDVFIGAACIAYFGVFTSDYRQELVEKWSIKCVEQGLPCTPGFNLISLADPFEVRVWNSSGLPRDNTSTENAVLATRGRRWPLMIDPQDQANRWIKQNEGARGLKVLRFSDGNFMRTLENCIRLGYPCLLEEVKETLEPALEPVLLRQIFYQNGRAMIRLGDSNVDYDNNFRLYMTTKMSNPHYLPEVCIKVTIINFTVTSSGLEDQLLSDVVSLERPDLESQRAALVSQINSDKNQLISLESKILKMLFQAEGNILDDEELIETLNSSKQTSTEIVKRVAQAEVTEKSISAARERYRPVASRGSVLYFVVAQLAELDPMYQYSLKYFSQVFNQCIGSIEKTDELEERLKVLRRETTLATYTNISRGLFEKDKLIFSFMLCCDILKSKDAITEAEWGFFLRGAAGVESGRTKRPPSAYWVNTQEWENVCDLENTLEIFDGMTLSTLDDVVKIHIGSFKIHLFERSDDDFEAVEKKPTDVWDKKLSKFQKILLIKCVLQEKLIAAVTEFVKHELGQQFVESPATDLTEIFKDLNKTTCLIFVLSVGSDPMAGFYRFASEQEMQERVSSISLGQGQGPIAETMIKNATENGDWVFLQNCHLASSWLPKLETIVKHISENPDGVNDSFRLYLSSMPTSTFPVSILQESVKITNEPPKGLRANVRRALVDMEREFFDNNILGDQWRRMVFGCCFFHAVIQERKKFGPLGWNIRYEFNDSDRQCCLLNLDMFCKNGDIPWDALEYITGQITYGGRITDNWDQRCLTTILKIFFSPPTLNPKHKYSPSGLYYAPILPMVLEYVEYVDGLPIMDEPEIFGMHDNATITFQRQESTTFLNALLSAQPKQAGGSAATASDEIALELAEEITNKLPEKLDLDKTADYLFFPDERGRTGSLTIFMQQEIERFNKLLAIIRDSLVQLKKGIKGLVVMSEDLEKMYQAFLNNQVPDLWKPKSYGSLKSLASWFKDFQLRFNFIRGWQTKALPPSSFWLSGFFFQQGFLTAVLQTYARRHNLPIDQLRFHFKMVPVVKEETIELDKKVEGAIELPEEGVLIHGLFLEAARWDMDKMTLADSFPGEMNPLLPIIHFLPSMEPTPTNKVYNTPLYKTSVRQGTLSTTGHSTNFIVPILLPSLFNTEDYWILKGTALLSQLTD